MPEGIETVMSPDVLADVAEAATTGNATD